MSILFPAFSQDTPVFTLSPEKTRGLGPANNVDVTGAMIQNIASCAQVIIFLEICHQSKPSDHQNVRILYTWPDSNHR